MYTVGMLILGIRNSQFRIGDSWDPFGPRQVSNVLIMLIRRYREFDCGFVDLTRVWL